MVSVSQLDKSMCEFLYRIDVMGKNTEARIRTNAGSKQVRYLTFCCFVQNYFFMRREHSSHKFETLVVGGPMDRGQVTMDSGVTGFTIKIPGAKEEFNYVEDFLRVGEREYRLFREEHILLDDVLDMLFTGYSKNFEPVIPMSEWELWVSKSDQA